MIDAKRLREMMEGDMTFARSVFEESGYLGACFVTVHQPNGSDLFSIDPAFFKTAKGGVMVGLLIGKHLREGAEAVVTMTEAWMVCKPIKLDTAAGKAELEQLQKIANGRKLHEHPDRKEVLIVVGQSSAMKISAQAEIVRDAAGKPTLGPWTFPDMELHGNMVPPSEFEAMTNPGMN